MNKAAPEKLINIRKTIDKIWSSNNTDKQKRVNTLKLLAKEIKLEVPRVVRCAPIYKGLIGMEYSYVMWVLATDPNHHGPVGPAFCEHGWCKVKRRFDALCDLFTQYLNMYRKYYCVFVTTSRPYQG